MNDSMYKYCRLVCDGCNVILWEIPYWIHHNFIADLSQSIINVRDTQCHARVCLNFRYQWKDFIKAFVMWLQCGHSHACWLVNIEFLQVYHCLQYNSHMVHVDDVIHIDALDLMCGWLCTRYG